MSAVGKEKTPGGKSRAKVLGWTLIIASVLATYISYQRWDAGLQLRSISYIAQASERLAEPSRPLVVEIVAIGGGSLRARLKFFDRSGAELTSIEKTWQGSEIDIEVAMLPLRGSKDSRARLAWMALPYRLYTDKVSPASGSLLFEAYDSGGFPAIMEGGKWSEAERSALVKAFSKAKRAAASKLPAFGEGSSPSSLAMQGLRIAKPEPGLSYALSCEKDGSIDIVESAAPEERGG